MRKPQEWVAIALAGFFDRDGRTLTEEQKGALAAQMALACAGIQGEVDVEMFQRTVFEPAAA